MSERLLLVDAYSMIYRAYFAIRSLTGPAGQPVNAIYGFTKMLRRLLTEQQPTHAAVVYDLGAPRLRLSILPSYKEQRPPTPPALEVQLPPIRDVLAALRVPVVEREGEEADDIIAALATQAADAGMATLIASTDKDFCQVVGPLVRLVRTEGKETIFTDTGAVRQRYGLEPAQMVDYFSLIGDSVDNIPGVAGVGPQTATALLQQFGSVEGILAAAPGIPKTKLRAALLGAGEQLQRNRSLIALCCHLELPVRPSELRVGQPDTERLRALYGQFGFKSLAAELDRPPATPDLFGVC